MTLYMGSFERILTAFLRSRILAAAGPLAVPAAGYGARSVLRQG